jgi:hypothetical protein
MPRQFRPAPFRLVIASAAAILAALPAMSRPLTPEESGKLGASVDRYLSAIGSEDTEGIVNAIPPRILNVFAGTAGIEAKDLKPTLQKQMEAMMKDSSFTDLTSDQSALDATDVTMSDGTPVTWAVVPTAFTADVKGKKTRNSQPLLALSEGGKWYFLRIDSPQARMLASLAYPFLSDAKLPEANSTAIP